MLLSYVLAILYFLFFTYLIYHLNFFKNLNIPFIILITIFIIKIFAGFVYAKFYLQPEYAVLADTWRYYALSVDEMYKILKNPSLFFSEILNPSIIKNNIFISTNSYWNDLKTIVPIKIFAILNLITNKNYYINMMILNFVSLFGLLNLLKVFEYYFPTKKNLQLAGIFLVPSFLFWNSGMHKDIIIVTILCFSIYWFHTFLLNNNKKKIILLLLSLSFLFILKNYLVVILFLSFICWWALEKLPFKKISVLIFLFISLIALIYVSTQLSQTFNIAHYISLKQQEFKSIEGNSVIDLPNIEPTALGLIQYFPYALNVSFFQPNYSSSSSLFVILSSSELFLLLFLIIYFLWKRKEKLNSYSFFIIFFCLAILLISGYTVTFFGSIIRYRSMIWPLIIPLALSLKFEKDFILK
jgi:hypothetical protein